MGKLGDSAFRKVDLHVHTPKSACYSDKSVTSEQIIDAALAAGLEAIAITDHNTAMAVDDIRRCASKNGLLVFPGVEFSAKEGHVLAIFDLETPVAFLEDFLGSVNIDGEKKGDARHVAGGMAELFQKIEERGGIAIAAHIERWPSGFLESNEPISAKRRIHEDPHLSALEITIPQNKSAWNSGQVNGYPKKHACVQGSDAHAPAEIGRRPVYIKMEKVGLEALRAAFIEFEAKIMFQSEINSD